MCEDELGVVFEPDENFDRHATGEQGHLNMKIVNVDDDDEMLRAVAEDDPSVPTDVHLFRQSQADAEDIFTERRKKYGSHLDNAKRFKSEDTCGLYLKCARMIRMIENGDVLDDDTLIDLANYCHLIRSGRGKV